MISKKTRTTVLITALIAILIVIATIANMGVLGQDDGRRLSPGSTQAKGAGAIAAILEDQGVAVTHVRNQVELGEIQADSTTLVVDPWQLSNGDISTLAGSGSEVIVLLPSGFSEAMRWGFSEREWGINVGDDQKAHVAQCEQGPITPAESEIGPITTIYMNAEGPACLPVQGGHAWVQSPRYENVWAFGAGEILTNIRLAELDNAGVAVRMLGRHPNLYWVENYASVEITEAQPARGLPAWLVAFFAACVATGLWYTVYRWRRFGKLVAEPMPVVVPVGEAETGRARLYSASRNPAHAARITRSAFISRYATRLGITELSNQQQVVEAFDAAIASHHQFRKPAERKEQPALDRDFLGSALYSYPVSTDQDLAHVVSMLGTIEKELTHVKQ